MPLESANMPRDDGRLTWMAAARMGDIKLLELYFSEGVDVNDKEPNGFSALHIAALYNNVDLARHLISIGASAKSTNNWNDTPLHRAATQGYAEMCQLLLEAGADPDFEDWRNKTPCDYAKEEVRAAAARVVYASSICLSPNALRVRADSSSALL